MNTRIFNDLFIVTRKNVSDTWADEDFVEVARVRGYAQPVSQSLATKSGKADQNASHILFCPADSNVKTGDIITDSYGRDMVVLGAQLNGVVGKDNHMEAGLMERA